MDEIQQLGLTVRTAKPQDGVIVVTLAGECDLYEAHRVEAALEAAGMSATFVLADLSELRFIDSTVVHVLLEAQRSFDAAGSRLVLVAPSTEVRRTLATAGLDGWFEIRDRLEFEVDAGDSTLPAESEPAAVHSFFRSVNERIFEISSSWRTDEEVHFFCECIDAACTRPVTMSRREYEGIRASSAGWLAMSPAHAADERWQIVGAGDGYLTAALDR